MKALTLSVVLFLVFKSISAQPEPVSQPVGMKELQEGNVYKYSAFVPGNIHFKDGSQSKARLNYHLFLAEIQFTNARGDTLTLANEQMIKYIAIASDTFYYTKEYCQLMSGNEKIKLAVNEKYILLNNDLVGGYGEKLSNGAVTPLGNINMGKVFNKLEINQTFKLENKYFIGDKEDTFIPLNKKNLMKRFPLHQNKINDFLQQHSINFSERNDVIKLSSFLQSL